MITVQRMNLAIALHEWINERERIEREQWKYTMDSGHLGGMRELLQALQTGEHVEFIGECT
jgi:hypothetical protein